jgi:uncharacterized membrane protein YdjX (TVP38/TMEM64 family)
MKPAAFVLAVAMVFVLSRFLPFAVWLWDALAWIDSLGTAGPLALGLVYIVGCVLMFPCFILTVGAGALFGVVTGFITVSLSSTLGATAAFLIGRYFARSFVARRIASYPRFRAVDRVIANAGWRIVGLLRLSPVFPFNVLNYGFGVTSVSLHEYVLASWIGMMPGTLLYVYAGSLAGNIATLGADSHTRTPTEWTLYLAGLGITVVAAVYITRLARRALEQTFEEPSTHP